MSYSICTLFEGHYHYGLAALVNSVYKRGFRGSVFAGYRGKLPAWCNNSKDTLLFEWAGSKSLEVAEGLQIHFLPVDTTYHFSNYKPEYMLRLFDGPAKDMEGLIYFDPDIVITCKWNFFEYWASFGVSVVDDVIWNNMPSSHPIRKGWEGLIESTNRKVTTQINSYLNGGFCGVSKANMEFLKVWSEFIELSISDFGHKGSEFKSLPRTTLFYCADQDALNIAAMCSGYPISEIGPEGMDFISGGWTMSHAISRPKPWVKKYILSALKGKPPSSAENNYWRNTLYPIYPFEKKGYVQFKYFSLKIASFIGRFYRRH